MNDREHDTVRSSVVREAAQFLARLVHLHVYPAEYHRVHYDGGKRFEVVVREHRTAEDTKPIGERDAK